MNLELRHLRYFVVLAEELNFARAARRLHMTQPPLSQQIMQLEDQMGTPLFIRGRRPLRLTDAGSELLVQSKRLLEHADNVVLSTKQAGRGERGNLTIAFITGSLPYLFPAIINRYTSKFPNVNLNLKELVSPFQRDALHTGSIDVGIMRPLQDEPNFETRILLKERMLVALPANHRYAQRQAIELEELAQEPFVSFDRKEANYFDVITTRIFGQIGSAPKIVQTASQMYTVLATVAAGMGLTFVPESAKALSFPGVIFREIAFATPIYAELALGWRRERVQPVLTNFINTALEVSEEMLPITK